MPAWHASKEWADTFTPQVAMLLGWGCLAEAPIDVDRHENTALMVAMAVARVAGRMRQAEERLPFHRHPAVPCRWRRPSGADTNLTTRLEASTGVPKEPPASQ